MNRQERNTKIEEYGRGPELLMEALSQLPREAWEFKLSPEDWSVHEIIVHMADSESMAALRARKLIVEPGSTLMGYREAEWSGALDYAHQEIQPALDIIRLAHVTTYRLLKTQPDNVFGHSVVHPEHDGLYTLDTWLEIYAAHIPDHIEQMKKAVASFVK